MSEYSDYFIGEPERETEKALLAPIVGFTDEAIWIPKSVIESETKKIKKWFIDKKNTEIKEKNDMEKELNKVSRDNEEDSNSS
jgi:hypothetical protein